DAEAVLRKPVEASKGARNRSFADGVPKQEFGNERAGAAGEVPAGGIAFAHLPLRHGGQPRPEWRRQVMQVHDVMTRGVECVAPDTTLQEAARKMKELDVGPMPVCDNDRLVGMLTDRDIAVRAVAEGRDPKTARVRDAMTEGINYCYEDDDVAVAARQM